ncbi:hypothetical protein Scep_026520 [Stephania cephalantha]|uniref:Uncharacterized protein n=1 Tax=Stephania cephalantha TaxID=152367 RepID=A0AAP0EKB9_9MAGN
MKGHTLYAWMRDILDLVARLAYFHQLALQSSKIQAANEIPTILLKVPLFLLIESLSKHQSQLVRSAPISKMNGVILVL